MSGPIWPSSELRGRVAGAIGLGPDPDLGLLEAWRAGDRRAAKSLLRRYYSLIRRTAVTKLPRLAIDGVVDRIVRELAEGREVFRGDAILKAYILSTARRSILDFYQKEPNGPLRGSWAMRCSVVDLGGGVTGGLVQAKNNQLLLEALRTIDFDDQFVLELHYWDNMQGVALAQVFGIAEALLRERLDRATRHLQRRIAELIRDLPEFAETIVDLGTWAQELRREISVHFKNQNRAGESIALGCDETPVER